MSVLLQAYGQVYVHWAGIYNITFSTILNLGEENEYRKEGKT